jgi:hypothetical protein
MMTHKPRPQYRDDYSDDDRDEYQRSRQRKSKNILDRIPLDWQLSLASIAIIFEACREVSIVSYLLVAAWVILFATITIYTDKGRGKPSIESKYRNFFRKYGRTGLLSVSLSVFGLTSLFLALAEPSYAVFLTGAETAFSDVFATGDSATSITAMIKLVFGVIRLIILMAVIFGVVKAIQARDDQEQVKAQLMLPFIILVGIAVVDVMTLLIFGT